MVVLALLALLRCLPLRRLAAELFLVFLGRAEGSGFDRFLLVLVHCFKVFEDSRVLLDKVFY